jgi:hypothetical protein
MKEAQQQPPGRRRAKTRDDAQPARRMDEVDAMRVFHI